VWKLNVTRFSGAIRCREDGGDSRWPVRREKAGPVSIGERYAVEY
jgi:hypothetical protein